MCYFCEEELVFSTSLSYVFVLFFLQEKFLLIQHTEVESSYAINTFNELKLNYLRLLERQESTH